MRKLLDQLATMDAKTAAAALFAGLCLIVIVVDSMTDGATPFRLTEGVDYRLVQMSDKTEANRAFWQCQVEECAMRRPSK